MWIRGLGLGLTNPVGTRGVFAVCLGLGCGGVAGIVGEWVGLGPWLLFAFQSVSSQYGCLASR